MTPRKAKASDAPVRVLVTARPCALDTAPNGSKCVVSRDPESIKRVRLLTPMGVEELPPDDLYYTLPTGTKVRRVDDATFEIWRLGESDRPIGTASDAREAVGLVHQLVT